MSSISAIEWCDCTWNCLVGCTKVSPGCDGCYAARDALRMGGNPNPKIAAAYGGLAIHTPGAGVDWTSVVRLLPERLAQPLHWRRPRRIFVNSESDLFHVAVPDAFIDQVIGVIQRCPQHTFMVLTKRAERLPRYVRGWQARQREAGKAPELPSGLWLGVSVESPEQTCRIEKLVSVPAAVRFVSAEPLLAGLNLRPWLDRLDWVVAGGESGPGARPLELDWIADLINQCHVEAEPAALPIFVKQLGSAWAAAWRRLGEQAIDRHGGLPQFWPAPFRVRQFPAGRAVPA